MPDFEARCRLLETENDELRARIANLEEMLGVHFDAPAFLGLGGKEGKFFGLLLKRDNVTKALAMDALYGDQPDADAPEEKIIDVFICKMRAKLAKFDLQIETNWGRGYFMTPAMKQRARDLIASQEAAA